MKDLTCRSMKLFEVSTYENYELPSHSRMIVEKVESWNLHEKAIISETSNLELLFQYYLLGVDC